MMLANPNAQAMKRELAALMADACKKDTKRVRDGTLKEEAGKASSRRRLIRAARATSSRRISRPGRPGKVGGGGSPRGF